MVSPFSPRGQLETLTAPLQDASGVISLSKTENLDLQTLPTLLRVVRGKSPEVGNLLLSLFVIPLQLRKVMIRSAPGRFHDVSVVGQKSASPL